MTIPAYGAAELRWALRFTDLIEPLRVAFGEFSHGGAQQVMSALWPARRPEDGNVLIKGTQAWRRRGCTPASTSRR